MKPNFNFFIESLKLIKKSAPGWAAANLFLSIIRSVTPLLLLALIKIFIDRISGIVNSGGAISDNNLLLIIGALAFVYLIDELSFDLSSWLRKNQSDRLEGHMYKLLHEKAVALDLINFERPEYFDILSRASKEATWRPNSILNNIILLLKGCISLLLIAGLVFTVHWSLVIILLIVNVPGILLRFKYAAILYNFQRKQTPEARKSAYFNWILTGDRPSRELRLFGLGEYFISLFRKSFIKQKEEEMNIIRKRTLIETSTGLFKAAALLFVLLFAARNTLDGSLSLGSMAMIILAFRQGMASIKEVFSSISGIYEDSLFIADAFEFLNLEDNIRAAEPVVPIKRLTNNIVVKNLSFTYPGNAVKTLDNISFEIKQGEVVAIVGHNGAGKSALVRLLCRLYDPDSGTIKFDGTDIVNFNPAEYRKLFSVIFQDFMLYNLTLGENIRLGGITDEKNDERIRSSADSAGLSSLVASFPNGYDAPIGNLFDSSRELSWGEWQKIALARSFYSKAPILILDEPSSALDANSEFEVFSSFKNTVRNRTAILISHRLASVLMADKIFVLEKGKIVESGSHEELMNKKSSYYEMYTKQAGYRQ